MVAGDVAKHGGAGAAGRFVATVALICQLYIQQKNCA